MIPNRRDREKSRYRRGMGARTSQTANERMANLYANTCLRMPKGVELYDLKGKAVKLDVLLYEVGKGNPFADEGMFHYERTYFVHKKVGPDNRTYVCPRETSRGKLPCPICEKRQELKEDPEADEKLIEALAPKRRQLFNIIDRNDPEKKVQILDFSYHLFGKLLLEYLEDEDHAEELKTWCEFEGGKTLRLGLKEKKFQGHPFYEVNRIEFMDRAKDYDPDKTLARVHCLDKLLKVLSYDELKKVFMQTGEDTEEGTKHKFRRSDLKKLSDMTDKQLRKFAIMNDMEVDPADFEDTESLVEAIKTEMLESFEDDEGSGKKNKKDKDDKKSDKKKDKDEDAEIEEGSTVTWTDDEGEDKSGTVTAIKGKKATVEDEDSEEHKVGLDELTLVTDNSGDEGGAEIEKDSEVTWTDDDGDEQTGTVIKIKGDTAKVKCGKKVVEVDVSDLTLVE